ncbi:hypothetical protein MANY_01070 [Mycolicibacterium anyangense]|uniref:HTH tetR-type domain-containing protein n=1 Tax=Mycolicibacterium anyangense TaxID=1431246 RepID=A0A6N4VYT5_9MYCO|nr:TetR/AcrR family transcriptional regulator [Mycolicibacterium anyangense]BBZ74770.1 hypothetical protein MANY_01070 [Mycolicibacterium anyangense]
MATKLGDGKSASADSAAVMAAERAELMDAAAVVLARNGWWGFKVSGVLRQAHMSTRSFYRQFETKDDLLAALLERDLLRMAGVIESLIDPAAPIPDRIWQYVGALISWGLDDEFAKPAALFASSYRGLLPQHPGLVERCLGALTAPLAEILAEGTRQGLLTSGDPNADARIVLSLVGVALFDSPATEPDDIRARFHQSVAPFIARSLGIDPPPSRP